MTPSLSPNGVASDRGTPPVPGTPPARFHRWRSMLLGVPVVLGIVLLAAAVAYVVTARQAPTYESHATLIVGQSLRAVNPTTDQLAASQRLSATYARVATMRPLLQAVIDSLGLDTTPERLDRRVTVTPDAESAILEIAVTDGDPERAAAIANALATELVDASPAVLGTEASVQQSIDDALRSTQDEIQSIQNQIDALVGQPTRTAADQARLVALQDQIVSLRGTYADLLPFSRSNATNLLTIVEPAVERTDPVEPRPALNALLAAILALLLASAVIFIPAYLDETVRTDKDVTQSGLQSLGMFTPGGRRVWPWAGRSATRDVVAMSHPEATPTQSLRSVRWSIEYAAGGGAQGVILFAGRGPAEGKTLVAANVAALFAQAGRRVLLVDGDLHRPRLHQLFKMSNNVGLTTALRDASAFNSVIQGTEQRGLSVMTSGPLPGLGTDLLGSRHLVGLLATARSMFDLVIIDSAPLEVGAEVPFLSSTADAAVLVIEAGHVKRETLIAARDTVESDGGRLLGVVVSDLPRGSLKRYVVDPLPSGVLQQT